MSKTIIELTDARKVYVQGKVEVVAVDDVSFAIDSGDFAAFSGPSGSGKTTILNLIGMLDSPTSGRILFEGKDVSKLSRTEMADLRRNRIGFIFQAYNLIPVLTAYENAELVLALQGVSAAKRREIVMALIEEVGLKGMEHRRPDELSGGQQQRVAIARAIASQPALILADEPTANVDSETAESILDLMQSLNEDRGVTFLFSTHDPRVMTRARRVIRLRDGRIDSDERRNGVAEASVEGHAP
jgi:putative ABC transport system ATP-binding protein